LAYRRDAQECFGIVQRAKSLHLMRDGYEALSGT
jgi:hypothetical protein